MRRIRTRRGPLVVVGLVILAAVVGLAIGFYGIGGGSTSVTRPGTGSLTVIPGSSPSSLGRGDPVAGKTVFASAGCGTCHTLDAAGSGGTSGPDLDEAQPGVELVVDRVTNGQGAMPSFKGRLSAGEIDDVAAFVVKSTRD